MLPHFLQCGDGGGQSPVAVTERLLPERVFEIKHSVRCSAIGSADHRSAAAILLNDSGHRGEKRDDGK